MTEQGAHAPRVLVTGATGFIGSHVVRALLRRGASVTALTRDAGRAGAHDWADQATVIQADLEDCPDALASELAAHDRIVHLAWDALGDFRSARHVEQVLPAHLGFLGRLVRSGARHLLAAGTCLEYGLREGALSEELPCEPVTAYGRGKDMLRRELEPLCRERGTALTWARLFYMHGPGQSQKALLSQLDRAINSGAGVFPMSGGQQWRDYLPVERVAELLAGLALPGGGHGVVNCASGRPVSVLQMVQEHLARRGAEIRLDLGHYPYPDYEPFRFWADTAKLEAILGRTGGGQGQH